MWAVQYSSHGKTWAGRILHSRPAPFQQRTNTSCYLVRYQPTVSRWFFRCLGAHLLRSPSTVNPGHIHVTCLAATGGYTPPAENLGSPTSIFVLASRTSARCRVVSYSPSRSFRRSVSVSVVHRENKKTCSPSASRVGKSWSSRDALYLLTFGDLAGGYVPGPDRH